MNQMGRELYNMRKKLHLRPQ